MFRYFLKLSKTNNTIHINILYTYMGCATLTTFDLFHFCFFFNIVKLTINITLTLLISRIDES